MTKSSKTRKPPAGNLQGFTKSSSPPTQPLPSGPLTPEELVAANRLHLAWLETWSKPLATKVAGVDLMSALTYELIQLLNNQYLAARTAPPEPEAKAA